MIKKTNLSVYNNAWYNPGGSRFSRVIWFFVNAIFFQNPMAFSSSLKVKLLRLFGAKVGKGVVLKPGINIKYPWNLEIGNDTWIGEKVWLDSLVKIEIGQNVCISQGAFLLTGSHNYKKTSFDLLLDKIILEDGVWIGANAVICPGVRCDSHSILTVNSVATTDLEPYMIYQGNPALPKRKRVLA